MELHSWFFDCSSIAVFNDNESIIQISTIPKKYLNKIFKSVELAKNAFREMKHWKKIGLLWKNSILHSTMSGEQRMR
jgi:hypothetical protein